MPETLPPLAHHSEAVADLVARTAPALVAVESGGRRPTSAIHWRPGVLVTAEEALERDEDLSVLLPGQKRVPARLVGRDPSTDVAALRFEPDGLPVAATGDAATLRAGALALAVGSFRGEPLASLGIVAFAGGAWESQRGGRIDGMLRLGLDLHPAGEGGALVDAAGKVLGMTVFGPRRRVLAIPARTVDRVLDQLLAQGHVARGYLGAGLHRVHLPAEPGDPAEPGRGLLVVGIDPEGPAGKAGLRVGDILTHWNGGALARVREVMRLLGPESVGTRVKLALIRGEARRELEVPIAARPTGG